MLLTEETTDSGEHRVYFTRQASVVSYFARAPDGGTTVHAHPGDFACPWGTTEQKVAAVRLAMLVETARRLNCQPEQVLSAKFAEISKIADPLPTHRHTWMGRSKARPRVRR